MNTFEALQCDSTLRENIDKIKNMNEKELKSRIKSNFKFIEQSMEKRMKVAQKYGLDLYSNLISQNIYTWNQWKKNLEFIVRYETHPKKRIKLLIPLAAITDGFYCDENFRIKHPDITPHIYATDSLDVLEYKFQVSISELMEILYFASIRKQIENNLIWYRFYVEVNFSCKINKLFIIIRSTSLK
jgi:hypothetical protein